LFPGTSFPKKAAQFWTICLTFTQIQFRNSNVQFLQPATKLPCSKCKAWFTVSQFRTESYGEVAKPNRYALFLELL